MQRRGIRNCAQSRRHSLSTGMSHVMPVTPVTHGLHGVLPSSILIVPLPFLPPFPPTRSFVPSSLLVSSLPANMDGRDWRVLPDPRSGAPLSSRAAPSSWGSGYGDSSRSQHSLPDPPSRFGTAAPDANPPFTGSSSSYTLTPIWHDHDIARPLPAPRPERARLPAPHQSAVVNGNVNGGFNVGNIGYGQSSAPVPGPQPPASLPQPVPVNSNKRPRRDTDAHASAHAITQDLEMLTRIAQDLKLSEDHSIAVQAYAQVSLD